MTEQEFKNFFALGLCVNGVAKREPVAYLYGGVRCPDINTVWVDKETYRHACIITGYPVGTILELTQEKMYFELGSEPSYDGVRFRPPCLRYYMISHPELKAWKLYDEDFDWTFNPSEYHRLIWTSHDILNEDGSVYLAATDPIPIYQ